jgi:hypothetical protein
LRGNDSRMSLDLLRGMLSRLVEISTLMMKPPNSIGSNQCSHYTMAPLVTNPCTHELASPEGYVSTRESRTQARIGKNNLELQMND